MSSVQRYALLSIVHHFVEVGTNGLPLKVGARPSFVYGGASVKLHCDAAGYTIQRAGEAMAGEFFVDNLLSALLGSTAQITLNVK